MGLCPCRSMRLRGPCSVRCPRKAGRRAPRRCSSKRPQSCVLRHTIPLDIPNANPLTACPIWTRSQLQYSVILQLEDAMSAVAAYDPETKEELYGTVQGRFSVE